MRTRSFVTASVLAAAALGCRDAEAPTGPQTEPTPTIVSWTTLAFRQISGGATHACGLAVDNQAYCWGANESGELGIGNQSGPDTCLFDTNFGLISFSCSTKPVLVAGGHSFRQISAGRGFSCGVTTRDVAFCWGVNPKGQLGNGTTTNKLRPVRIATQVRIREVAAGVEHACAVSVGDIVYCWGRNDLAQLGDGTLTDRLVPTRVAGRVHFKTVSAGWRHNCGVGLDSRAYCWGLAMVDPGDALLRPTPVRGGRTFKQVRAGYNHTCGVGADDRAYCWGLNDDELGSASPSPDPLYQSTPLLVAGGHRYLAVSTSQNHSCGVTLGHVAYCWGHGAFGIGLGDGKTIGSLTPVKVAGGFQFRDVSVLPTAACAVTVADQAYCWGTNGAGELGDGTTTDRPTPVPVVGDM
jgi:alpha-tubulin suppressor-like RCC1 family protein